MRKITFSILSALVLISLQSFSQTISCGGSHSVAICNNNTVTSWGGGFHGQLGNGGNTLSTSPVPTSVITGVTHVDAGWQHTIALKSNGTAWSWGGNSQGQLGNGTTSPINTPAQIAGLTNVIGVAAGRIFSAALLANGTVYNWGNLLGTTSLNTTPVQVPGLSGIIAISCGGYHFLALKNDGTVWGWRENIWGQLGNGAIIPISAPVQMTGLTGIVAIEGGDNFSLALKNDGTVWACGNNGYGQLGTGTTGGNTTTAIQVPGLSGVVAIAAQALGGFALKNNGTVWAWGSNDYCELGVGDTLPRLSPTQVTGVSGITSIEAGMMDFLALKNDGTVWAWGYNLEGEVGDGTTVKRHTPAQVNSLCTVSQGCSANFTLYPDAITPHQYWVVNLASGNSPLTYSWNWGDGSPTDNIALPSHTYANAGTYTICLTISDANGCSDVHCYNSYLARMETNNVMVYVNVIAPTAIPENKSGTSFSVFPNPATEEIILQFEKEEQHLIQLRNMIGEIVIEVKNNSAHAKIDVSDLQGGIYFITVIDEQNNSVTKKIVKM